MAGMDEYTVGAVAELAGVSVRTLHHYDEIGLLEPSERSAAGYRLYSAADLARLSRILFYREPDFELGAIAEILADPGAAHLEEQRRLLTERIDRHRAMVAVIDKELAARRLGMRHGVLPAAAGSGRRRTRRRTGWRCGPSRPTSTSASRRHLARWFHDCDHDVHRELAKVYRANERVGRNYDDMAPDLSRYVHDAIMANSDRRAEGVATS